MSRHFCIDVKSEAGILTLKKAVEQIIKKNQKVFDNLAKSKKHKTDFLTGFKWS
jgi:Asp-tRNA(Asn)/Glu-tRNA(Gln) amidotransferase B subunit